MQGFNENELSTDLCLSEIKKGNTPKVTRDHNADYARALLKEGLDAGSVTLGTLSKETGISKSYLSDFLNGKNDGMRRDKLIAICIVLGFDIDLTQRVLESLHAGNLYAKNARDILILEGIRDGKALRQIDDSLYEADFPTLITC